MHIYREREMYICIQNYTDMYVCVCGRVRFCLQISTCASVCVIEKERERERQSLNHLLIRQWIRSNIHASQKPSAPIFYMFPVFETSATGLCGTTGMNILIYVHMYLSLSLSLCKCVCNRFGRMATHREKLDAKMPI